MDAKYSGLTIGQHVLCNGYEGTVTRLCEWSDSLIEVRLRSGLVCVDSKEVLPLAPAGVDRKLTV